MTLSPEQQLKLKELHRKRGVVQGQITLFTKILSNFETDPTKGDFDYVITCFEKLSMHWAYFDDLQFEIEGLSPNEETKRYELQSNYCLAEAKFNKLKRNYCPAINSIAVHNETITTQSAMTNNSLQVKLPQISLPNFSGSYEEWNSFFDLFKSLIHDNLQLTGIQKMQYLRSALRDKAAKAIESLETTEKNYHDAIEILKRKYDCKRKIIMRHWSLLKNLPRVSKDSPDAIGELIDNFQQHVRALENLGEPVSHWNTPLLDLLLSKITSNLLFQWELTLKDNNVPSYTHLLEFLEKRANCSDSTKDRSYDHKNANFRTTSNNRAHKEVKQTFLTKPYVPCPTCNESHSIRKCSIFLEMPVEKKLEVVKRASLCFNCLSPTHSSNQCKSNACFKCHKRHHTLLHRQEIVEDIQNVAPSTSQPNNNPQPRPAGESFTANSRPVNFLINHHKSDLIVTASMYVYNKMREPVKCRALIDTCSTTHFITDKFANLLNLPKQPYVMSIGGLDTCSTASKHVTKSSIKSLSGNYERELQFLVVPNIAELIPQHPIDRNALRIPRNIKLADPQFHVPAPVDILLGAGVALSLFCVGQINLSMITGDDLYLQKTKLGWVLGGSAPTLLPKVKEECYLQKLQFDMNQFWEIEDVKLPVETLDESYCEKHYQKHVHRNEQGRYVVALPFNDKINLLGESRDRALNRFRNLQVKLAKNTEFQKAYQANLQEYVDLGHMSEISVNPLEEKGYFLPHHAVVKESSLTTKIRVVFDGSAKTTTGVSLNQALHVGPKLQTDLCTLLIRFRTYATVFTGDIEKMYRQILIRPEDRQYQRILWTKPSGKITTYQLNTVTFGLGPSPFLAIRTLHQLAKDEGHKYPLAAKILREEMYVDDAVTGAQNIEEALRKRDQLINILNSAGFSIRQWASNNPNLLKDLPRESINLKYQLLESPTLKTLGISWNAENDDIIYTVTPPSDNLRISKRNILSRIARIFDPLGLLGPIITFAKVFMQKLWSEKLNWDESLPLALFSEWNKFQQQLDNLPSISFPRHISLSNANTIELHGFCDASERAFGACIYLKTIDNHGHCKVELVCSKSRVAPLKTITIPKLELCGALILSKLQNVILMASKITFDKIYLWTDSTIVLHWLHTSPNQLKLFVANRVSEIQSLTTIENWRYVRSHDNPADALSRGQLPDEFIKNPLWKHGPSWLFENSETWPSFKPSIKPENILERKRVILVSFPTIQVDYSVLEKYSNMSKLEAVVAYCRRFLKNNKYKGYLTLTELNAARYTILKMVQTLFYAKEIKALKNNIPISTNSKLLNLQPFLDEQGVIRVGGRLKNSKLNYSNRHPIVLPRSHHITVLLIRREHIGNYHAGIQTTLYSLRQRYWLIDGRNQVRKVIRACVTCSRFNLSPVNYVMGDLPSTRTVPSKPFSKVGTDYCGPFFIKEKKFRNRNKVKIWVAVFVCLVTKAIHLEVVSDMTTEAFIAALQRFISRRGLCTDIYSDHGTNFVGTNNELQKLWSNENHKEQILKFTNQKGMRWHFIPVRAPHFGGLWEAAVKSFKHHFKRVVGANLFTYEEMNTFVIGIESVLNSRPLTPMSCDPNDLQALTPGHFLIGVPLTSLPEYDFENVPDNRLSRWQHLQKLRQHFWKRWHKEYLNELMIRHKWNKGVPEIAVGTIVLIKEDNLPPLHWNLARVVELHPGNDGVVRVVSLQTPTNIVKRSVKALAPLPIQHVGEQTSMNSSTCAD